MCALQFGALRKAREFNSCHLMHSVHILKAICALCMKRQTLDNKALVARICCSFVAWFIAQLHHSSLRLSRKCVSRENVCRRNWTANYANMFGGGIWLSFWKSNLSTRWLIRCQILSDYADLSDFFYFVSLAINVTQCLFSAFVNRVAQFQAIWAC